MRSLKQGIVNNPTPYFAALGLALLLTIGSIGWNIWHNGYRAGQAAAAVNDIRMLTIQDKDGVTVMVPVTRSQVSETLFDQAWAVDTFRSEGSFMYVSDYAGQDPTISLSREHLDSFARGKTAYAAHSVKLVQVTYPTTRSSS